MSIITKNSAKSILERTPFKGPMASSLDYWQKSPVQRRSAGFLFSLMQSLLTPNCFDNTFCVRDKGVTDSSLSGCTEQVRCTVRQKVSDKQFQLGQKISVYWNVLWRNKYLSVQDLCSTSILFRYFWLRCQWNKRQEKTWILFDGILFSN